MYRYEEDLSPFSFDEFPPVQCHALGYSRGARFLSCHILPITENLSVIVSCGPSYGRNYKGGDG